MKIIRMVRTEMEAPGNIDFVRWGDIYPMPGTCVVHAPTFWDLCPGCTEDLLAFLDPNTK
jgi:hypothetical protein